MLAPPRSVAFARSTSSQHSTTSSRGGFVTTTTRTTTTTTTTTTVRRLAPRSITASALLRPRASPPSTRPMAAVGSSARFVARMLEEPLRADFYANIWAAAPAADAGAAVAALTPAERRKRRARRRAAEPLVDIAQVAHVVTTLSDYRADYAPLPRMSAAPLNIWTHSADADDEREDAASEGSDDRAFDGPVLSLYRSNAPATAAAHPFGALPRRISEVSDEGSADGGGGRCLMDDAHLAFSAVAKPAAARSSDPLETSFADSEASAATAATSAAAALSFGERGPRPALPGPALQRAPSVDSAVPPPSSLKNGSVVFSAVFSEEREWGWAVKFLLGIHEPLRHALFVMDRFLEQSYQQPGREGPGRQFFAWFKSYFVEYLRCQHDVKAGVLHPLLQLKYSTKLEVAKTYDEIDHFVARIQLQERQLCGAGVAADPAAWLARLEALQTEIRRLNLTLHGVLNLEERTLHPALSATFSEKTFHQYVMPRVFRAIKAKRVVVPWILDRSKVWGGEAEQQSIQSMLPFSARFLYRKLWLPYFRSNVAGAMKSLNEFVDPAGAGLGPPDARKAADSSGVCAIQ
ncbi:hypothetical protein PybrP1_005912 [[Pythium] brassicae (nom. inval.)]|nr:hypothetical protein PybrP1_005912 [[Pythium] brassicae (nom. inval.)]